MDSNMWFAVTLLTTVLLGFLIEWLNYRRYLVSEQPYRKIEVSPLDSEKDIYGNDLNFDTNIK